MPVLRFVCPATGHQVETDFDLDPQTSPAFARHHYVDLPSCEQPHLLARGGMAGELNPNTMGPATTLAAMARRVIDWRGRHGDDLMALATRFLRYRQPLVTVRRGSTKSETKYLRVAAKRPPFTAAHGGKRW